VLASSIVSVTRDDRDGIMTENRKEKVVCFKVSGEPAQAMCFFVFCVLCTFGVI